MAAQVRRTSGRVSNREGNMVSYFVRYRGAVARSGGVPDHYETAARRDLAAISQHPFAHPASPVAWTDPFPVRRGETMLLAQMQFDSTSDLDAALRSPARQAARDDFHRFPPFRRRSDA